MLQEIKRDPSACIQRYDLAVYEGARLECFGRASDMRELVCEQVSAPRPERNASLIPASKTAVAVELNFIEPFPPSGSSSTNLAYIGSMNLSFVKGRLCGFIRVRFIRPLQET